MPLTLKRGYGRCFNGENWKSVKDSKWVHHRVYVPYGEEPLHGTRLIDGVEHAVFRCRNDDFFAQPVALCELPPATDPMRIYAEMPEDAVEEMLPPRDHRPPEPEPVAVKPKAPPRSSAPTGKKVELPVFMKLEQMDD